MSALGPTATAEVLGGKILVHVTFAQMFVAQRISGARWDGQRLAWSYPAGRTYAIALRKAMPGIQGSADFEALLAGRQIAAPPPAPKPVAAPVALPPLPPPPTPETEITVPIPEGLLTKLWRHQLAGVKFCLDRFAAGLRGILLAMSMGTGKSLVFLYFVLALGARRVLILCPLRVVPVWVTQFARHVGIPVVLVALDDEVGSVAKKTELAKEKLKLAETLGEPFICVINYDSAWRSPFAEWAKKIRWDLIGADECVPADTLINTLSGPVSIQSLQPGDLVLGVDDLGQITTAQVTATFRRFSSQGLVQIDSLLATVEHPIWIQDRGYVRAGSVRPGDMVRVYENNHDCLRMVRCVVHEDSLWGKLETPLLRQGVLRTMENVAAGICGRDLQQAELASPIRGHEAEPTGPGISSAASIAPAFREQSISGPGGESQGRGGASRARLPHAQWRQWNWSDAAAENAGRAIGLANGVHCTDEDASALRLSHPLQAGHCGTELADCCGSRWPEPSGERADCQRREEGRVSGALGLADCPREERSGPGRLRERGEQHLVFNIETTTGNYFANGILVHNCHRMKSPTGKAAKYVSQLARIAAYRVGLTGTPMPHNHTDIFGIMRFVDVAILGQYWTPFKATYCQMGGYQNKQIVAPRNMDQLNQRVGRVMFRVGPEVLDLPPETQVNYRCELSPEGRRVYRELNEYFIAGVKDGTITVTNAMVKVLRLAQLTGGWMKTDEGERTHVDDSKQKLLEDTLDDIGHLEPVVVFCWFHEDLDAVHDACRRLSMKSMELSGRRDEKARWEGGEAQVLAVQIKSGGVGVDFTRARYSIFYSLGFSLADYEQAKKRVHRPGQTRPVEHIHLLVKNTVDERIMRALEKRKEVIEAILAEIVNNS